LPSNPSSSTQSVVARSDDGTIQITFTIPFKIVKKSQEEVMSELSKNIEIPGFRKGFAPLDKIREKLSPETILEKTLSKILPELLADSINKHKIALAVYPKFELVNVAENHDWQIRAVTCEIPGVNLGDYKKKLSAAISGRTIWTPGKPIEDSKSQLKISQKQDKLIKALLEHIPVKIPKLLIDTEVNARLSDLLARLEKLSLSLESYLSSIGKSAQQLRDEYTEKAGAAVRLDLILSKIAEEEKITIDVKEIDAVINAGRADPKVGQDADSPQRRRLIEAVLKRKKALDYLTSNF